MKKNLVLSMILMGAISFNVNAGDWNDIQEVYLDIQGWFLNVGKPSKPEW